MFLPQMFAVFEKELMHLFLAEASLISFLLCAKKASLAPVLTPNFFGGAVRIKDVSYLHHEFLVRWILQVPAKSQINREENWLIEWR